MRASQVGSEVEGDSLELQCRKINLHGPIKEKLIKGVVWRFKLSIHGYARVAKTLSDPSKRLSKGSLIQLGDEIHGEAISGFSVKPLNKASVAHATASHKATFISSRAYSYAAVEIGVREMLQARKGIEDGSV